MSQYSHFWVLYNKLPNRYEGLKEELISQFTNNRSTSLKSMQPQEYAHLITYLNSLVTEQKHSRKKKWSNNNMDWCRKSVIASICGYFDLSGQHYDVRKAIATACRQQEYQILI